MRLSVPIEDSLDLHAFAPRDVKRAVEAYLDEAQARGFPLVRIIHGRGIGVQREIVRKVLERTSFVANSMMLRRRRGAGGPPWSGSARMPDLSYMNKAH